MENAKKLKEVNKEIENKLEKKENLENKLQQLNNRAKKLEIETSIKEHKKINYRLIQRGEMLEKYIDGAEEKTNEEVAEILDKVFLNID